MKYKVGDYIYFKKNNSSLLNNSIGLIIEKINDSKFIVELFNNNLIKVNGYYTWNGYIYRSNRWYVYEEDIEKKINKSLINLL